ncbi:MAG: SMP-30/gluconolactonase/LRE family protein [Pseudomonadota bacterium]
MTIDTRDARLHEIVDPAAHIEVISDAFEFIEGPIWHPGEASLIFSDIPGDTLYRWHAGRGVETYRSPSNMANGNTYDRAGRILSCEHATSRVVREAQGELTVLASHWGELELNSPNDIVVARDGTILFTDPTFGRTGDHGVRRDLQLDYPAISINRTACA